MVDSQHYLLFFKESLDRKLLSGEAGNLKTKLRVSELEEHGHLVVHNHLWVNLAHVYCLILQVQ